MRERDNGAAACLEVCVEVGGQHHANSEAN